MSAVDPFHAEAEVVAANELFYQAFTHADLRMMSKLWAHLTTVSCIHPGMSVLLGRDAVMRSWTSLLSEPPEMPLVCIEPQVVVMKGSAIVTCYESAGGQPAHLAATNVFVMENLEWKMVHHQAGPMEHPVAARAPTGALN